MPMPQCGGLGIYRRRTFKLEVRHCRHGHRLDGHNLEANAAGVFCRPCYLLRKRRWYWAKQLAAYWEDVNDPALPNRGRADRSRIANQAS